jgi:hypothetical protein
MPRVKLVNGTPTISMRREQQLGKLRDFGYTEMKARLLYLVAVHSGSFTVGRVLNFAKARAARAMPVPLLRAQGRRRFRTVGY